MRGVPASEPLALLARNVGARRWSRRWAGGPDTGISFRCTRRSVRAYHFCNSRESSETRGAPLSVCEGGLLGYSDDARAEALLRQRPPAFSDVQLLSAIAAAWNSTGAKSFREGTSQGARRVWISSHRICGDAESRTSFDQRTEEAHAVYGTANAETARFTKDEEAERSFAKRAVVISVLR